MTPEIIRKPQLEIDEGIRSRGNVPKLLQRYPRRKRRVVAQIEEKDDC